MGTRLQVLHGVQTCLAKLVEGSQQPPHLKCRSSPGAEEGDPEVAEKCSSLSHFVCVGHEAKIINTACPGASPRTALGFPQEEPSPPFLPAPPVALTPSFWMGAHGDGVGIKGRGESAQAQGIVPLGLGDKTHGQVWWRSPSTMGPGEVRRGPPSEAGACPLSSRSLGTHHPEAMLLGLTLCLLWSATCWAERKSH